MTKTVESTGGLGRLDTEVSDRVGKCINNLLFGPDADRKVRSVTYEQARRLVAVAFEVAYLPPEGSRILPSEAEELLGLYDIFIKPPNDETTEGRTQFVGRTLGKLCTSGPRDIRQATEDRYPGKAPEALILDLACMSIEAPPQIIRPGSVLRPTTRRVGLVDLQVSQPNSSSTDSGGDSRSSRVIERRRRRHDRRDGENYSGCNYTRDPVANYLNRIGDHPILTPNQEKVLGRKVRAGLDASEKLKVATLSDD